MWVKADAGYARKLGEERRSHLQQRLKKFVDADLLSELAQVINLLAEYDVDKHITNYVLVDRLDESWINSSIKYQLIRALIEALKSLRRISDLKVVVAIRSDLMEKIVHDTRGLGFQSEKYEDYIHRIVWTSGQLKDLVNKRINFLFRKKYNSENVFFEDIFSDRVDKERTINYMIDRTLMRPRDLITFVNICLERAEGNASVSRQDVHSGERIYSENRRLALIDEWRPVFATVEPTLKVLEGRRAFFSLFELNTTDFSNLLLKYIYSDQSYVGDDLMAAIDRATGGGGEIGDLILFVMERLYLMGAVGLNTSPTLPVQWFYKSQRRIDKASLDLNTRVRVHPMLHSALGILQ